MAMLLVLLSAFPVVIASAILVRIPMPVTLTAALIAVTISNALLYRLGPDLPREQRLCSVWPGAIVATFLWMAATSGFLWYLRELASYNVVYGSLAAVIALMVWLYLLMAGVLVGCEYNAVRWRERNP
jgi:membrane protein